MRESLLKWDTMFWVLFVDLNEKLLLGRKRKTYQI
jgi:hypothetical protein